MAFIRNTDKLVEGVSNLWFTNARAQSALASTVSSLESADIALDGRLDVIEGVGAGSIAKAQADAQAYADSQISALVNSAPAVLDTLKELADALGNDPSFATTISGQIGALDGRLDVIEGSGEGSVAKALLDAKAYADSLDTAMDLRVDALELDPVSKTYVDGLFATKSTSDLAEGSNLYYTQGRFDSAFSAKSTTNLSEGTNLYYTQARFDSALSAKSTSNLSEGTNLYFTSARAKEAAVVNSSAGNETDQAMSVSASKGYFQPLISGAESGAQKNVGDVEVFSSNGNIDADNVMCLVDLTGGSVTLTLPNVSGMAVGRKYIVKEQKGLASQSVFVTVQRQGSSEKIDGENSYQIKVPYESISIMWDGSNWLIF